MPQHEKLKRLKQAVHLPIGLKKTRNFNFLRRSSEISNAQFVRISSLGLWKHSANIISVGYVLNRPFSLLVFPWTAQCAGPELNSAYHIKKPSQMVLRLIAELQVPITF